MQVGQPVRIQSQEMVAVEEEVAYVVETLLQITVHIPIMAVVVAVAQMVVQAAQVGKTVHQVVQQLVVQVVYLLDKMKDVVIVLVGVVKVAQVVV